MVNVLSTEQNLANTLVSYGDYIGVCTGPPGNTRTPYNEAVYENNGARQHTEWDTGQNGNVTGSTVTLDLPAGTFPYMIVCQGSSGDNMVDWAILPTPIVLGAPQQVQITPAAVVN